MALDEGLARKAIAPLAERLGFPVERTAHGMLGIVVANMVRAIRAVSVERGHDPRAFALLPFGGAGPLHATDVAKSLGIRRILVPFAPGILCAQGLIVSDLRETFVRTAVTPLDDDAHGGRRRAHRRAEGAGRALVRRRSASSRRTAASRSCSTCAMSGRTSSWRSGSATPIRCRAADAIKQRFFAAHERAYGFHNPADPIEIVNFRLIAVGKLRQPARAAGEPRRAGNAQAASRPRGLVRGRAAAGHAGLSIARR